MIEVTLNTDEITRVLAQAMQTLSDGGMRDIMSDIGEQLLPSTQDRIYRGGPAPDATPWAPKKESTYQRYGASGEGVDRRPLIHLGALVGQGPHFSFGANFAELGVSPFYAIFMQTDVKKGAFGAYSGTDKNGRKYSGVAPWGDISARPFVGISQQDETDILDIISGALRGAFQ